ncbi:MAG TPA: NAD(P)/FAD-dependent oxidoreductase [Sphingomicrobium sp.]
MRKAARPHVVIIGAGFGGIAAAQRLANRAVDVTLIDRRNHHVFQPLLYQVATAALSPADIAGPIRAIFAKARNIRVVLDEVTGVDRKAKTVSLANGRPIGFDQLIIATGARHSYFGNDSWARHAPGLKSIEDALAIRRKVLLALERAETEADLDRRRALLTFVVVGGGATGVEMAGAIAELARRSVSNDFRSITPRCSRVILVEAGDRILPGFPSDLSEAAKRSLEQLGVEVRLACLVKQLGAGFVSLGRNLICAETIVWAAGVKASPAAEWLRADRDSNGRIWVNDQLRVPGIPGVFAIGDTASLASPERRPLPAIAPVAKQQGRFVADLILGRSSGPFRYRDHGNLATIGRSRAVADLGKMHLSGLLAWLLWSVAHVWFLIGFRSRLAVTLTWLWSYFTYQRSARLITGEITPPAGAIASPIPERKCA